MNIAVKIMRADPASENQKLEKRPESDDWKELQPVDLKFASHGTLHCVNLAEMSHSLLCSWES